MKIDYLSRQPYIDLLKSIIANQSNNPLGYSFAINGEWGCGKTWILNELENQLLEENKSKYLIFHYNAWENDFYAEPLVAILSIMIETLEKIFKYEKFVNEVNEKLFSITLKMLKNLAISFANVTVKDKIGVDCRDVIGDFENVKYVKSDIKNLENQIDTFLPLKNGIKEIQNQLKELSKEKTLLVVVDELDRCLPEYAIKVLERLHHICNEIPVIQMLAINNQNFSDSIAKVFGKDYIEKENPAEWKIVFAESYLQKFVDMIIPLPNGELSDNLEVLNGLEKNFEPFERKEYDKNFIKVDETFLISFITSTMNGVDRRFQEKILKQVALCHKLAVESKIKDKTERQTYAILIYEILSCIAKYVFHSNSSFKVRESIDKKNIELSFFQVYGMSKSSYEAEYYRLNRNIEQFFRVPKFENQQNNFNYPYFIHDTKTYLMAFFTDKPEFSYNCTESYIWDSISEDKIFLQKYDEIMSLFLQEKIGI